MCGLTGWFMPEGSKWRPDKKLIEFWIKGVEARGKDATGYWTYTDEPDAEGHHRFWMKGPKTASAFIPDLNEPDVPVGRIGLLHTRSWTVGSPHFNENNHPLVVGQTVVTHNGGFSDQKAVYRKLGIEKPIADVDSAIIPHALDALGAVDGLKLIEDETPGLAAIVAIMPNLDLVLAKDGRPLYIAKLPENGFMWSSESDVCFAMQEWGGGRGFITARFPSLSYMIFDGRTGAKKLEGNFSLKLPPVRSAQHASGMGFTGSRSPVQTYTTTGMPICAWGSCTQAGTKMVFDVDNKEKYVCKPHKKQWRRGTPIPGL